MILRDYQEDAVRATIASYAAGHRRPAMVMATGGGKTPTFSHLVKQAAGYGKPSLVLAHRTELIDQAIDKLKQVAPELRIGRFQGSLKQWRADVVVGSIQTASRPAGLRLLSAAGVGFIVIDECHHAAATSYRTLLTELGAYDAAGPLTLGVTATLGRSDGLALGDVFDDVPYRIGLGDLIRRGYLVPPRGIRIKIADLDLSRTRKLAGDLNSGQLARAMHDALAPAAIVRGWEEHAKGRQTIAFMPSVDLSREQAQAFRDAGHSAAHVDANSADRDAVLEAYRRGEITILCNCGLFTEGTDLPDTSCVILKPTMSAELYQQMVGRGLRLAPGKVDCIIIDPAGVTGRHRLSTIASLDGHGNDDDDEAIPDDLFMYEVDQLAETVDDRSEAPAPPPDGPTGVDGPLQHELIDLFGESHSAWQRTNGGLWFLHTPQAFIYLQPREAGRYDLRWRARGQSANAGAAGTMREGLDLEYAMAAGDEYVASVPMYQLTRDAAYRRSRAGQRADAVAQAEASRILD